ncbi:MAG: EAL domain-containing protein [Geminicoccaceae bacterium]|nr:EAL domain-containing protein [Geminicoccaceae bacterium]
MMVHGTPIRTLLAKNIAFVTIIISITIAAASMSIFKFQQDQAERVQLQIKITNYANLIDANLRVADFATIAQLAELAAIDPDFNMVRVTNHLSTVIMEYASPDFTSSSVVERRLIWSPDPERYGHSSLEFGLRPQHFDRQDITVLAAVGILNVAACTILGAWLFHTIHARIGVPLKDICDAIENHQGDNWQQIRVNGPQEVQALGHALNTMAGDLVDRANHDALTGMANRWAMQQHLDQTIAGASRAGQRVAILLADLDHFKYINDHFGHMSGDGVLTQFGTRLGSLVDENIRVFRLGGDEFVIAIENADNRNTRETLDSLAELSSHEFEVGGMQHRLSCSVGSAVYPDDASDVQDLIRKADLALYRAKANGRHRHVAYDASQLSENAMWVAISGCLRAAVDMPLLHHAFQSIHLTNDGVCWGAEALMRLRSHELPRANFPPDMVMRVACELGMQDFVAMKTIENALNWLCRQPHPINVTLNLSWEQIARPELREILIEQMKTRGIDPRRVVIELTEDRLLQDPMLGEVLHSYAETGVAIALDDFGTGFSSLSCLTRLPVTIVKTDKSLIWGLAHDPKARALFLGIADIAHRLNLTIIAEGIETENHLEEARSARCDLVQGFLFGKPAISQLRIA